MKQPIEHKGGDRPVATMALPRHRQISEALVRDIRAGLLPHGTRLKPERVMAAEFSISVGTLRQALAHLEELGLLKRVQGSGNYIQYAGKEDQVAHIYSLFHLELIGGGGLPTAEFIGSRRLKKPKDLAQLGSDPKALQIRRLRKLDGKPAAVEEIWVDGARSKGLRKENLSEALYQLYATKLGFAVHDVTDRIWVAPPPSWKPEDFGPDLDIWGFIERWSYDANRVAVEFSRTWYNPETTRYTARWRQAL